ncbi:LysM peptidoglycan-binding domain-containing protein [Cohnella faecalis]|uniref:LysM peptidoglycan-binding domain-containing protein n=1 Tax=Cohnella faecalis TaxID=2315694 RepID=A0A398CU19_9BACL|nr:LysM peptidoglycan-binding domain-containing protein [Cohnella faecalis]RIE04769.1 LysM peptidoglycan-binding domain-containing protein [Cohnella faecalis]
MVHAWVIGSASKMTTNQSAATQQQARSYRKNQSTSLKKAAANRGENATISGIRVVRIVFVLVAFLILFSGFTLVHSFASPNANVPASAEETVVLVDSGDSLWSIASSYKKKEMDTRKAVHHIMKRNGLEESSLTTGQKLIIPVEVHS